MKKEEITLKRDGVEVPVQILKKFLVAAHAETGAGVANIGKTAWVEATVEAGQGSKYISDNRTDNSCNKFVREFQ